MPRFPKNQAQIAALAELIRTGLKDNPAIFPAPPVGSVILGLKRNQFVNARDSALSAQAAAEQATTDKDQALQNLIEAMKADLRYAENTVDFDDAKLKLIGWSAKKSPTALLPPGQTLALEVPTQGEASLTLSWTPPSPADGGKPNAYKVMRMIDGGTGGWTDVATAVKPEATLTDQPTRQTLQYKVIAINKAGESPESNTVEVVL
jgi:multidrug efflux pump subunit AcrA (membrane-fusion protein)